MAVAIAVALMVLVAVALGGALLHGGAGPAPTAPFAYSTEPLHAPLARTPPDPRGTVLLVHSGGWHGPSASAQQDLFQRVSPTLLSAGYRVVSIDYAPGTAGLRSVEHAIRDELIHHPMSGPTCLYGESAGAHLALLAAQHSGRVDCVATYGAPTDLTAYTAAARAERKAMPQMSEIAAAIRIVFGADPRGWSRWSTVPGAARMKAAVLMMVNADDPIIPPSQIAIFQRARPTTETYVPPPVRDPKPSDVWVHGTATPAGKQQILQHLLAFVERAHH